MHIGRDVGGLPGLSALLAAALIAAGCRDPVSPGRGGPGGPASAQSTTGTHLTGLGAMGPGTATPGSDRQTFDFDVTDAPGGRFTYTDFSVVRSTGSVATMTVDPSADPATAITSFTQSSTACATFAGTGRADDGRLGQFAAAACDNGSPGVGVDSVRIWIPGSGYGKSGKLTDGEITLSGGSPPTTTNRIGGVGTIGPGTPTLGSDLQEFNFDVASTLAGRLFYRDWSAVRSNGTTAAFTATCSGLACAFTDGSSDPDGSVVAWQWTFGEGGTATEQSPSHTYATAGSYTVTLTVTDNQGATASTSNTVTVTAPNQPPTASFTLSCNGLTCGFTSTSRDPDGTITAYNWTFRVGRSASAQ